MTYIYRLAGENLELAEAELKGFLRSQDISEDPDRRNRIAETTSEPEMLKRLALTHEISQKITEIGFEELEEIDIDLDLQNSFAVKAKAISGELGPQKIEEIIGNKISSERNSVDLENPETEIMAYALEETILLGEKVLDINRGLFQDRSNEKRPFSSPVSLDPVLARVLVNLAEVPTGGKVLDPYCGTGGILIEAGLCGILPCGTDVKENMIEGAKKNLEEYGIINHDMRQGEAENALNEFSHSFDAIITDLPYGKASRIEGSPKRDFTDIIRNFKGKTVFIYNKKELGNLEADFEVYVHKNLTRYIFIR